MRPDDFAVYAPPRRDLPYLAVEISADGSVVATAYETQVEAERHRRMAQETVEGDGSAATRHREPRLS